MLSRENEYMIGDALSTLFAYGKHFSKLEFCDMSDKTSNIIDILNNIITATSIPVGVLKNDIPALGDSKVYMYGDYCFELPWLNDAPFLAGHSTTIFSKDCLYQLLFLDNLVHLLPYKYYYFALFSYTLPVLFANNHLYVKTVLHDLKGQHNGCR